MRFVRIPAGEFLMGSPEDEDSRVEDESPQHPVVIARAFYLQETEVSNRQFRRFRPDHVSSRHEPVFDLDDHPVVNVTWYEAREFARWLSSRDGRTYRLPTEAEWEYACRAGTTTPFWWGTSISPDLANYESTVGYRGGPTAPARGTTVPVRSYRPNRWGLYQVHGNVGEWCEDVFRWPYGEDDVRPDGEPYEWTSRVVRGGNWGVYASLLRCAFRAVLPPEDYRPYVGLRLAADLSQTAR